MTRPRRSQQNMTMTGLLSRVRMLNSVPENLRPMLGAETTRAGIHRFWSMIQHETLNRRFVWIIIELFISTLFPKNTIFKVFEAQKKQSL
jgi:hypothetical protein